MVGEGGVGFQEYVSRSDHAGLFGEMHVFD